MNVRKLSRHFAAVAGVGLLWAAVGQSQGLRLSQVEVVAGDAGARLVLDVDGVVTTRSFTLQNPDRVVVDLLGAHNGVREASRDYATGPVSRVRVSQFKSEPDPVVRVVADLRQSLPFEVTQHGEDVVVVVGTEAEAAADVASTDATSVVEDAAATVSPVPQESSGYVPFTPVASSAVPSDAAVVAPEQSDVSTVDPVSQPAVDAGATAAAVSTSSDNWNTVPQSTVVSHETEDTASPAAEPMEVAQAPRGRRPAPVQSSAPATTLTPTTTPTVTATDDIQLAPSGSTARINLDVQNADIHTVLRTLADYSGRNIIASREVDGEVSARLYDTPWADALESILRAHGFGMIEENGIIRVGVMQKLRSEELEEAAADRKRDDLLPIETQVVKLQFADADEMKPALQDMLSARGKLQVDARTNALIISDIPDFVTKVATMASDLDSRTPQVEIVSKLVDVSVDDSKDLGISWDAINIQPAGSPVGGSASVSASSATPAGLLRLGTVQSWGQLDGVLDALEKQKKANVVSNPNITTVNNREARILVGAKIPLIVADQAGNAITQLTKIGIQMSVIPHVNSDQTITLDLHTEVSELSSQATVQGGVIIQTSEADTRVLVENGDTAIIGGLVRNVESTTRTGVPLLQSVPLIGWLFRNTNTVDAKRELIIFVTPRLIEKGMRSFGPQGEPKIEK